MDWFYNNDAPVRYDKLSDDPVLNIHSKKIVMGDKQWFYCITGTDSLYNIRMTSSRGKSPLSDVHLLTTNFRPSYCIEYCQQHYTNLTGHTSECHSRGATLTQYNVSLPNELEWFTYNNEKVKLLGTVKDLKNINIPYLLDAYNNIYLTTKNLESKFEIRSDEDCFNLFIVCKETNGQRKIESDKLIETLIHKCELYIENNSTFENKSIDIINDQFVPIIGSYFFMGCTPAEDIRATIKEMQHLVLLTESFEIMKTPLTKLIERQIISLSENRPALKKYEGLPAAEENLPFCSSKDDFDIICKKLNNIHAEYFYRLPTEAEWEYCCRAGTSGAQYGPLDDVAWYHKNSDKKMQPVGLKQPNAWGLYDTLGNCNEWTCDAFIAKYFTSKNRFILHPFPAVVNPHPIIKGVPIVATVIKGGAYDSDKPRAASRNSLSSNDNKPGAGARFVRFKVSPEEKVRLREKYKV